MAKNPTAKNSKAGTLSTVSAAFIDNHAFLKKFLTRFLSELQDVEDVLQETYLRASSAEQNKEIEYPKAFLFCIARNLALTELTKKSRQITNYVEDFDLPIVIDNESNVENEIEARQQLGIYCEAVAALPEQCRRVYLLRKVHGLSHKDIAERMGLTVSSVEKHLLKGVLKCRSYVREREEGRQCGQRSDMSRSAIREQKK